MFGNLQRFNPVGRTGAVAVAYGGRMVVFGGQDANGFLLADTQLFNTVTMQWEAPMLPLGTPPPGRAFAGAALLPSTAGVLLTDNSFAPSSSIAIFGGIGPASTFSDISTLSFTPCSRFAVDPATGLSYAGISTVSSSAGGTICTYTCVVPFTRRNAFATCNVDGTWDALMPLCFADASSSGLLPGAPAFTTPTVVTPTNVSGAAVTTTFSLPAQVGFGNPTGPTSYTLSTASQSWFYRFVGQELDQTSAEAWRINPGLPPNSAVLNTWSIERFTGYLALGTAPLGVCRVAQQDCSILTRPFPTGEALPNIATDAWTLEAVVSFNMNTADTPVSLNQIGVGIYMTDTPVPNVVNPLNASARVTLTGGLHFFTSLKMQGTTFQWCFESLNSATPLNTCGNAPSLLGSAAIPGVTGFTYGTFRIDRSPSELLQNNVTVQRPGRGSWRFGQRFLPGWPYSYTRWMSDESLLRPNAAGQFVFNPATAQIAVVGVAGSSTLRSFGQVRSLNFRRLVVDTPGPVLSFAASTSLAAPTQTVTTPAVFTAASNLLFKARSSGSLGVGAWSAVSTTNVAVPYSPALVWNASSWIEVALRKPTGGVDNLGLLPTNPLAGAVATDFASQYGNDGIPNGVPGGPDITAAQYFVNYVSHTTGSWWWVDFGIPTAVKEIVLYNRFDQVSPRALRARGEESKACRNVAPRALRVI